MNNSLSFILVLKFREVTQRARMKTYSLPMEYLGVVEVYGVANIRKRIKSNYFFKKNYKKMKHA